MQIRQNPRILLQRHYVDIDAWGQEIGWDLEYQQIEPGPIRVSAYAFGTDHCIVTRGEFSHSVRQVGAPPDGMITLGLPDDDVASFRWCGVSGSGGDIVNFSLQNGFEGTSPAGFSGFAISFSKELFTDTVEHLELSANLSELICSQAVWTDAHQLTHKLRRGLARILHDADTRNSKEVAELFHYDAVVEILQFISGRAAAVEKFCLPLRSHATRRALRWLEESDNPGVTVEELCRQTGVSAPTLYRGFQEEFGIGPKRFMRVRRLARTRKELLSGDVDQSITDIANDWGFWHMGQFAADYRRHFGELPSQTRSRMKKN